MNTYPLIIHINAGLGNQLFMLFAGISKAIDEIKISYISKF